MNACTRINKLSLEKKIELQWLSKPTGLLQWNTLSGKEKKPKPLLGFTKGSRFVIYWWRRSIPSLGPFSMQDGGAITSVKINSLKLIKLTKNCYLLSSIIQDVKVFGFPAVNRARTIC